MKYLTIVCLIGLLMISCQSIEDLQGPPGQSSSDRSHLSEGEYEVIDIQAVSREEIEITFNQAYSSDILNVSNFSVSHPDMSIIEIVPVQSNVISLIISNQTPGELIQINIHDRVFVNEEMGPAQDTNQMIYFTNYLIGNNITIDSFGSDDLEAPIIDVFTPLDNQEYNLRIGDIMHLNGYVYDQVGIAKLEYKFDNGTYREIDFMNTILDYFGLPEGEHQLIVRATDYSGNTAVDSVIIDIIYQDIDFVITEPTPFLRYVPGDPVDLSAYIGTIYASNITEVSISLSNTITNYDWLPLNQTSLHEWTTNYTPSWLESGTNKLIGRMVFTNSSGDYATNYISDISVYYDNCVYLSKNGDDNKNGTRLQPVRSTGRAREILYAYGLQNIRLTEGSFGRLDIDKSSVNITGSYSADYLSLSPSLYQTKVESVYIRKSFSTVLNLDIDNSVNSYAAYFLGGHHMLSNCSLHSTRSVARFNDNNGFNEILDCVFRNNNSRALTVFGNGNDIIRCDFINNRASRGGALYLNGSSDIEDCYFHDNRASHSGGAVYIAGGYHHIKDNTFNNNNVHSTAKDGARGGAIYLHNSRYRIEDNHFVYNGVYQNGYDDLYLGYYYYSAYGGGIYAYVYNNLTHIIQNNDFEYNGAFANKNPVFYQLATAFGGAGAFYFNNHQKNGLTHSGNSFTGNIAHLNYQNFAYDH